MQLDRILLALKPWQRALPIDAEHARRLTSAGGQLRVVTSVFDASVAAAHERGDVAARATQQRAVAVARVELERLVRALRRGSATVTTEIVWGVPAYETIAAATREWRADLLVLGAHEPQAEQARLTDTDWQLLSRTTCPLLLVKSGRCTGYDTIVAAVDPAPADDTALAAGRRLAHAFGATLCAVDATVTDEVVRAAEPRTCIVAVRTAHEPLPGGTVEAAVSAPVGDVLLVPAVEQGSQVRREQPG